MATPCWCVCLKKNTKNRLCINTKPHVLSQNVSFCPIQKSTNFIFRLQHVERRMLEGLLGQGVENVGKASISTKQQHIGPDCLLHDP